MEARYKQHITFDAKPVTEIATDVEGAAGLASGDKKKADDKKAKKDEPKKKGFGARSSITGQQAGAVEPAGRVGRRARSRARSRREGRLEPEPARP